jgi:hypothetical protein
LEAGIGPESFDPTELQTLESSDDAHPHGSLDFFELGSSRWYSLGETTIRTRRTEDGTQPLTCLISGTIRCSHRLVSQPTIGFEDYLARIQSLKNDQVLEALKPALMSFFKAIAQDPIPS